MTAVSLEREIAVIRIRAQNNINNPLHITLRHTQDTKTQPFTQPFTHTHTHTHGHTRTHTDTTFRQHSYFADDPLVEVLHFFHFRS